MFRIIIKKYLAVALIFLALLCIFRDFKYRINNNYYWKNERVLLNFELDTIKYVINKYNTKMPYVIYQVYDPGSRILLDGYHVYPDSNIVIFMNTEFNSMKFPLTKCVNGYKNCDLNEIDLSKGNFNKNNYITTNRNEYHHRMLKLTINKIQVLEVIKASSDGFNVIGKIIN
jgi:hypothetical protein